MTAIYSFLLSLLISASLVPVLARVAGPLGLLDRPGGRKLHQAPVPRVGGVAVLAGALVAVAAWVPASQTSMAYLAGAALIGLFGLLDDRVDLHYRVKFAVQVAAGLLVIVWGDVLITRLPFVDAPLSPGLSVPLTLFAIVGVTNAMNLTDGLDGLAGGTSLLASATLGYLAYLGGDKAVALIAICLGGATLGFLRYNTTPARVFLGDGGSQFLGFSVAVLAILAVEQANAVLSPLVPLLVLATPVLDTLYVMGHRIATGRPPFKADRTHLHHRLLDLGMNQHEAVLTIYALQVLMAVLAWRFRYWGEGVLLGIFCAYAVIVFGGLWAVERRGLRWPHSHEKPSFISRAIHWHERRGGLGLLGQRLLTVAVPGFFLFSSLSVDQVPADVGWLALVLLATLLVAVRLAWGAIAFVERLVAFVVAVTAPFLIESSAQFGSNARLGLHVFFGLVAVAIAFWVRFVGRRDFQTSPLDFLVLVLVAVVPNVPALRELGYGPVAIEALILFYACDLLLGDRPYALNFFRLALMATLGVVAVRGLWP